MQIYLVGGAVRDSLLGLPLKDRDYVVVGATSGEMLSAGFVQVGQDFPVFLHPLTRDEYALARRERKTTQGYRGFEIDANQTVTLEQDLLRRDLTINAMAQALNSSGEVTGDVIDPYGGQQDLAQKVLRHISPAFVEDPVRILRVARFAARFEQFSVAAETVNLMSAMVDSGEVDALVPERTWQELSRGLMEAAPQRLFEVLRECGALSRILPELDDIWLTQDEVVSLASPAEESKTAFHRGIAVNLHSLSSNKRQNSLSVGNRVGVKRMCLLKQAAHAHFILAERFAVVMQALAISATEKATSIAQLHAICKRLRVPNECARLAELVLRHYPTVVQAKNLSADGWVDLLQACDAWRQPQRYEELIRVCLLLATQSTEFAVTLAYFKQICAVARAVNSGKIAAAHAHDPTSIPVAIRTARVDAIEALLFSA